MTGQPTTVRVRRARGLAVEATVDVVAIVLIMAGLGPRLYQTERW